MDTHDLDHKQNSVFDIDNCFPIAKEELEEFLSNLIKGCFLCVHEAPCSSTP